MQQFPRSAEMSTKVAAGYFLCSPCTVSIIVFYDILSRSYLQH